MTSLKDVLLYDPQLIAEWAERTWAEATANGTAESLGAAWTATVSGQAHEVVTDARCVMPQTIPFEADDDDLFRDAAQL